MWLRRELNPRRGGAEIPRDGILFAPNGRIPRDGILFAPNGRISRDGILFATNGRIPRDGILFSTNGRVSRGGIPCDRIRCDGIPRGRIPIIECGSRRGNVLTHSLKLIPGHRRLVVVYSQRQP